MSRSTIPLSEPFLAGNEWKYLKDCLDSGWVSSVGEYVDLFEKKIASYIGTSYAVATINGTAALHLGLIACGVEANDEVIVPALTFIAPANAVRYISAYPVFMDSDRETLCIDVVKTRDFIKRECRQRKDGFAYNKRTGRRVAAIIPVHIFGHPADMDGLLEICSPYQIKVIEDATESLGSVYKGRKTASLGNVGCLSFNGNKIITSGGGGMVVTNDKFVAERARHLSTQAKKSPFEYEHDMVGYNYRLSNIQAALGVAQLEKLERFVLLKRSIAAQYQKLLERVPEVSIVWEQSWARSNFWLNTIKVPRRQKRSLLNYLCAQGIQARPLWRIIPTLAMYRGFQSYQVRNALQAYQGCFNLPSGVDLKKQDMLRICKHIRRYFKAG